METKREFLKKLGLLTAGGIVGGAMTPAMAAKSTSDAFASNKKIGLQIYSLGRELTADVPNGLKKISKIGYNAIELAGYRNRKMGKIEIADYRKMADDAGIQITGSHVKPPIRKYTKDNRGEIADFWKQTVEDHVKFGVTTLVQPSMPTIENHEDAANVCEVFNNAGEIAKAANIKWGYHNHDAEFKKISKGESKPQMGSHRRQKGDVVYDLLLNGTDPKLVFFEMDVYWTVMGQNDPLEYFEKYPGRFPVLHIKDRSILGNSGMMNFENIFTKAYENGLDEFYVELENIKEDITQFEGVKRCFDYLNKSKFVKK